MITYEEKAVARDIYNKIKEVSMSNKWIPFRVNYGSHGVRDYILKYIEDEYLNEPVSDTSYHYYLDLGLADQVDD